MPTWSSSTSDARFFLSALDGLSDAEAARAVLPFPSQEIDPYRGLAPHFDVASTRAATLFAMASGAARLVVASASALLPRLSPPRRLAEAGLVLRAGLDISPQLLAERLVDAGYAREDPTDEPGEFSVRGGAADFAGRNSRFGSSSSATIALFAGTIWRRSDRSAAWTRRTSCRSRSS